MPIRLKEELIARKGFIKRFLDRIKHGGYVNRRLNSINQIVINDRFTTRFTSHYTTRVLFQAFLCTRYFRVKPDVFYLLKCYDLCVLVLRNLDAKYSEEFVFEFLETCPTFYWEQRIDAIFKDGLLKRESKTVLEDFKNVCAWKITLDRQHNEFIKQVQNKTPLLRKLLILMRLEHERILSK